MKTFFFLFFLTLVGGALIGAQLILTLSQKHVITYAPVRTTPRDTSIPYCPTRSFGQPQMFLPCMYSSLEKSA